MNGDPAFRCSAAGLDRGDDIAGTASTVRSFLLVENPGPWGVDAVRDSRFPPAVKEGLGAAAARARVRPLLIRRFHRRAPLRGFRVYAARTGLDAGVDVQPGCRPPSSTAPRTCSASTSRRWAPAARPAWCPPTRRSCSSARTASTTPAARSRAGRSRRRSRRRTPTRPGRSPTSVATGSRATRSCCPTGCTSVGSIPRRPRRRRRTCSAGACRSTCCAAAPACRCPPRPPRSRCSATSGRPPWRPSACSGSDATAELTTVDLATAEDHWRVVVRTTLGLDVQLTCRALRLNPNPHHEVVELARI